MSDDSELLLEHVERRSDEAFRTLVERHSSMVHGVAMRIVRDKLLAEEITQAVFIILARKGAGLRRGTVLAGWLHRTARFVALEALRGEHRRRQKLNHFAQMNDSPQTFSVWDQIAPLLEEAMSHLGARDRDVVVLRYLEEKSFAEVASAIGASEGAVKMRAGRALEKLLWRCPSDTQPDGNLCACPWAECAMKRKFGATGGRISAPFPARLFR